MEVDQRDVPNITNGYELFVRRIGIWYRRINDRGERIVQQVDPLKMLIHDKSVNYLDLAVKSCNRDIRRDHVKFGTIRKLPLACAEYLIAESEIPETSMLGTFFSKMDELQQKKLNKCNKELFYLSRRFYYSYKKRFFERLERLDRHQKKISIHGLMNTHRKLGINVFNQTEYESLIRECTSPSRESDPALTIQVLKTMCNSIRNKSQAFLLAPNKCLKTMLSHAKVMRFDFWGLWRGIGGFSTKFNPIADFINDDRFSCTIILLKYGFPYLSTRPIYDKQCLRLCGLRMRHRHIIPDDGYYELRQYERFIQLQRNQNNARMMLLLTTFLTIANFEEAEDIPANIISTLVCLMRCVPDPYVSPTEMYNELHRFLLPGSINDLDRVCCMYRDANIYEEDYTVFKPRKLAHLCRCVIRRAIANNLKLPEGINKLRMPGPLKAYLSLKS